MRRLLYLIVFLIVVVFGVTFTYKNPQTVEVVYYGGIHWEIPLSLLLLITIVTGAVVGAGCVVLSNLKLRHRLARARRDLRHESQTLPIAQSDSPEPG